MSNPKHSIVRIVKGQMNGSNRQLVVQFLNAEPHWSDPTCEHTGYIEMVEETTSFERPEPAEDAQTPESSKKGFLQRLFGHTDSIIDTPKPSEPILFDAEQLEGIFRMTVCEKHDADGEIGSDFHGDHFVKFTQLATLDPENY